MNLFEIVIKGRKKMIDGKVIIDFHYDDISKCTWNMRQEGKDTLSKEDLINLFKHVVGDLMTVD